MTDRRKDQQVAKSATAGARASGARRRAAPDPISAGLKALWAGVEEEPVPADFLTLLDQIDTAREAGKVPGEGSRT